MKLSIDIDDAELKEVISKGIKDLDKETVTALAKEAICAYLCTNDGISSLLYKPGYDRWDNRKEVRPEVFEMLKNSFTKEEVEEYRRKFFGVIEEERGQLMTKLLANIFSNMLMTEDAKQELQMELIRLANPPRN